ncbi:hypothetical protein ASZ90_019420 [hydrocarbon metagenome]|uniref:Uncharacterized protein n=1 Tax=hydrocarbon metagenome TaxID=938273 RepID=A0A0W8E3H4_9ZZZZ
MGVQGAATAIGIAAGLLLENRELSCEGWGRQWVNERITASGIP